MNKCSCTLIIEIKMLPIDELLELRYNFDVNITDIDI